jgi:hypothetical protein
MFLPVSPWRCNGLAATAKSFAQKKYLSDAVIMRHLLKKPVF